MAAFALVRHQNQRRLGGLVDPPREVSFAEKYRPRTLAEITGNLAILARLRKFLANPYPRPFLFTGPTGTGKTTTGLALAHDLGAVEFGGLQIIQSSCQDVETIRRATVGCNYAPWPARGSSGWHCLLVEEADLASKQARYLWLSFLEDLPARTVVVFTSNVASAFDQRFLDRCDCLDFPSDVASCLDAAQVFADHVWEAETGGQDGPDVRELPNVVLGGQVSFRRLVSALETLARATPPELVALAARWLDAGAVGGDSVHRAAAELRVYLEAEHRNKWHRVRDVLVGLWDRADGRTELKATRAFSRLWK